MPRGIPRIKELGEQQGEVKLQDPEVKKEEDLISVVSKMLAETEEKLLSVITSLNNRLEVLEKQPEQPEKKEQTMGVVKQDEKCPEDIRKLVSEKISPKCSVTVTDSKTTPTFTVHITLPVELQSQENDVRSKTVSYAEGINGISEWLDKVKKNIWETFKSRGESVPNVK